ncbi:MAG: enoyl-CoA hydratase/isomerase family protein [Oscillospiraceae bacterium]|nr:enoyl-CoA hydratase/isomerase family protein [Oscillospiraceae bacterium]
MDYSAYSYLKIETREDGVCMVTLNRPEKLNALDSNAWTEIGNFFLAADTDDDIRVVIMTGAGDKAFAAGADLSMLYTKTSAMTMQSNLGHRALDAMEKCSKPVIAAVNGFAFGGGCEVSLGADFRVVSENAVFALPETGLGILPGSGGTQRLARLVGLGRAKEMIMLGKKVKGPDAVAYGLAYKCVPADQLMAEAEKMASMLLAKAPLSLAVSKRVTQMSMSSSIDVGMYTELLALSALCGTEDKQEGVGSFLEKRTPDYKRK